MGHSVWRATITVRDKRKAGTLYIRPAEAFLGGLSLWPLRCLTPDRQTYSVMLLQPDGVIEASVNRIGHRDQARGASLCRSFLRQSVEERADLVVAPEYCVPWSIVEEIAHQGSALRPDAGAMWVLGLESIAWADLMSAVDRLRNAGNFVHHEVIAAAALQLKAYVDPLLYVFCCSQPDGSPILCFVIQFKTAPCRDGLDVEQRSLALGSVVYTFNRGLNQIGLMSIICSDAFDFDDATVDDFHRGMLLIHVQLNPKPAHADYARYRTRLLSVASGRDVELLCLNWAGNVIERTTVGDKPWNNNAGSAYYVPPEKFNAEDQIVDEAHRRGLYYSIVGHWHALYLNQCPRVTLLQKQKVMMHGDPRSLMPTTCATVARCWAWSPDGAALTVSPDADDGFLGVVATYPNLPAQLQPLLAHSPLAVERALEMLVGAPRKPDRWFEVAALESMRVTASETLRRVTVHQDFDPASEGVPFRKQRLQRAQDAVTLPGNGVRWPAPLSDLEQGFSFAWAHQQPHQNVQATQTGRGAGLVYLGDQSDDAEIQKVYAVLLEATSTHAASHAVRSNGDIQNAITHGRDRLCIIYRRNHQLEVWGVERVSRIDRPLESSALDIAGEPT